MPRNSRPGYSVTSAFCIAQSGTWHLRQGRRIIVSFRLAGTKQPVASAEGPMQRIGFIAFPNFAILALSTVSVFEFANSLAREPLYDLHLLSETGGRIQNPHGLNAETGIVDDTVFGTLNVLSTPEHTPTLSPGVRTRFRHA